MEATQTGPNRTGTTSAPDDLKLMLEAVDEFSPREDINTPLIDDERKTYIEDADSVGSIPPARGAAKAFAGAVGGTDMMGILFDKIGERIAFERTGTRLYDALIVKYLALRPDAERGPKSRKGGDGGSSESADGFGLDALLKIRAEELRHFQLLSEAMVSLGGDPTAQTPCADVAGTASMGLMQVVSDPRTTLEQSLSAMLTAELTDNASWELLCELADQAGEEELAKKFEAALASEAEHLTTVRGWLESLVLNAAGSPAV
jgi:hypothetical protein